MRKSSFFLVVVFLARAAWATVRVPTVVFLSDFGVKDGAVAVCKGVMWQIEPELRVVDLTHEATPYDIRLAGRLLEQTVPFYPEGTVFIAVVDPGVGSERKSIALRTKMGHFFVGPDNGVFTAVTALEGLDAAVELKEPKYFRGTDRVSSTFHGRDIFSPVAAHLAAGVALERLGPRLDRILLLPERSASLKDGALIGEVGYVEDPYGNVVTNIPRELVEKAGLKIGDVLSVAIGETKIILPFKKTFGDVPEGKPLAVFHSRGLLSFSLNMGDFAQAYRVKPYQPVTIVKHQQ